MRTGDIVIPKGTILVHDAEMSESFDHLLLYVNVDPLSLEQHFTKCVDERAMVVMPYRIGDGERP